MLWRHQSSSRTWHGCLLLLLLLLMMTVPSQTDITLLHHHVLVGAPTPPLSAPTVLAVEQRRAAVVVHCDLGVVTQQAAPSLLVNHPLGQCHCQHPPSNQQQQQPQLTRPLSSDPLQSVPCTTTTRMRLMLPVVMLMAINSSRRRRMVGARVLLFRCRTGAPHCSKCW